MHALEDFGDCIGTESCVDLRTDIDDMVELVSDRRRRGGGKMDRLLGMKREKKEKEFPPPIPWLARTENLPSHMPWVLRRYYSGDGRLIIKKEKVRHHEYFLARRADGRLTLQLVPLDDDYEGGFDECEDEDEDAKLKDLCDGYAEESCDDDKGLGMEVLPDDQTVTKEAVIRLPESCTDSTGGGGGGGGGGKCCKYNGVRSNPCMYGMPVPAIRPVHI